MIPFPLAASRNEARDNAMHLARTALDVDGREITRLCMLAEVWSRIAQTFPEEQPVLAVDYGQAVEDYHPYPAADTTAVLQLPQKQYADQHGLRYADGTVVVDGDLWHVLRVLATRYVQGSMTHTATVDLREQFESRLTFIQNGDDPIVQAMIESPRN